MGVDANWGRFTICPEMSRFVPVCPLLSLGPGTGTNRDKRGQTGTKRDISGQSVRAACLQNETAPEEL